MIGDTKQVAIEMLMASLSTVITEETDGNNDMQERLRKTPRLRIWIDVVENKHEVALHVRCFTTEVDLQNNCPDLILFRLEDNRDKWRTYARELGLRMPPLSQTGTDEVN